MWRRKERNKWRHEKHTCSFLSRNHPNIGKMIVYFCRLLLTNRNSDCHVQRVAAQHIYCTICTVCNWTVLTVIRHKLPLMFSCTTAHKLSDWCLLNCSTSGCFKLYTFQYAHIQSSRYTAPFKLTLLTHNTVSPVHRTTKHTQLLLCLELYVCTDSHMKSLDPSTSR